MQHNVARSEGQCDEWNRCVPDKETTMRYMVTYDLMETLRNTNQWLGATALSMSSYPIFRMVPNPAFQ